MGSITIIFWLLSGKGRRSLAYITAQADPQQPTQNTLSMRVIMRDGAEIIGVSDGWDNLESFTSDALDTVIRILDLPDEQPFRLL